MKFVIKHVLVKVEGWEWAYEWSLTKGSETICRSARVFGDEKECRSNIAAARKSLPGVRFAKVVVATNE